MIGVVFGFLNAALWIMWSGSWIGNLINAGPFAFLMYVCVRSLEKSNSLTKGEWIFFLAAAMAISAGEIVLYFSEGTLYTVLDTLNYIVLFSFTIYLIFKTIDVLSSGNADKALALSTSAFAMSAVSIYLSYEPIYFVAETELLISEILTCFAVMKKDKEAAES